MEQQEFNYQHYAKFVTGVKFYPESYDKYAYKKIADAGQTYRVYPDIPLLIFPIKFLFGKKVIASETTWIQRDIMFPAEYEILTLSKRQKQNERVRLVDGYLGWCSEVRIQWSDNTTERKYFKTNKDGQEYFKKIVEEWLLNDAQNAH